MIRDEEFRDVFPTWEYWLIQNLPARIATPYLRLRGYEIRDYGLDPITLKHRQELWRNGERLKVFEKDIELTPWPESGYNVINGGRTK